MFLILPDAFDRRKFGGLGELAGENNFVAIISRSAGAVLDYIYA